MELQFSHPSNDPRPLAIAKLMLAVAWVEGKLSHGDSLKIRRYLDSVIRMNDEDLNSFNLYQEYAIEPMERRRLARRFAQRYQSSADRKELIMRLESLLPKGKESMNKTMAIQEIKEALVEDQINFIKKVQHKLTRTPFPAKISDLGREAFLQEYTANPMFFRLKLKIGDNFHSLNLSAKRAEKLCLELCMIGMIIYADQILLPEELELCTEYLKTWELKDEHIEMLLTMALCRELSEGQIPAMCQRYTELSNHDERQRFYLELGKIARSDEQLSEGESDVLVKIAEGLNIAMGVRRSVTENAGVETTASE